MTLRTSGVVTKVIRKCTSPAFKNLQEGDTLSFSVGIHSVGSNRGRSYSVYITVINQRTGAESHLSFNQIGSVLKCCEISEVCP